MRGRLRLGLLAAALALLLTACPGGDGGGGTPLQGPVEPPTGLAAIAGDGTVSLTWTASGTTEVDQYNILQGTSGTELSVVADVDAGKLSHLATGLSNGSEYFFAVEARHPDGRLSERTPVVSAVPNDGTWPVVTSSVPADGDTGVATNTNIALNFSAAMDEASAEAAFAVSPPVTCAFRWSADSDRLTCEPQGGLASGEDYTVTLGTDARDQDGKPLATAYTASFTTGVAVIGVCTFGESVFGACTFGP